MQKSFAIRVIAVLGLFFAGFASRESIAAEADLILTAFSIFEPNPIAPGAQLTRIRYSVINIGPANIGSFTTGPGRVQLTVYLSLNSLFGDSDDINLGSLTSSVTLPAGSSSEITTSNPNGLPFTAPSTSGSYHAFLRVIPDPTRTIVDPDLSDNVAQNLGLVSVGDPRPFVVSVSRLVPTSSLTAATSVTYRVVFSESVNNVSVEDFTLVDVSDTIFDESVISVSASSGGQIDVTVNTGTEDGTLRLDVLVPAATISDSSGQGLAEGFSGGEVYSIDKSAPEIVEVARITPNPRSSAVTNVDVIFSERIDPSTFTVMDVILTRNNSPISLTGAIIISSLSNTTYRISGLDFLTAGEGAYSLTVNASGIQDLSGNVGIGASSVTWSLSRPSLAIRTSTDQPLVSWPSWAEGYILQQSIALPSSFEWLTVTNEPVVVGDNKTVLLNNTGTNTYFRLKKP